MLYTKMNSKWIIDLKGKPKIIKLRKKSVKKIFVTLSWEEIS